MAGINSLGIGSGVLTSDLVDQLREADDNVIIKPLENKIELANQQEDAYKLLESLMSTFQASTKALDSDALYLARATTGSTDEVSVKALDGTAVQSFTITDAIKAENDVWNSQSLATKSTAISDLGEGTLTVSLGGTDYAIAYTAASTLNDIRDSINEEAGDVMTASVLQVGEDAYQLVVTAKNTNEAITFSDSIAAAKQTDTITLSGTTGTGDTFDWDDGNGNSISVILSDGISADASRAEIKAIFEADETLAELYTFTESATSGEFTIESKTDGLAFTGTSLLTGTQTISSAVTTTEADDSLASKLQLNNIQTANAATFKYNGIEITRDTNEITDLITGVTITLNQDQVPSDSTSLTPESAFIKISQNSTSISTEMSLLVSSYNSLVTNLDDMTKSDRETGAVGIFNGESFVKSIKTDITNSLLQMDSNRVSLVNYGISVDREGVMSFDSSVFNTKFEEDPEGLETYFSGSSAIEAQDATETTAAVVAQNAVVGLFETLDTLMSGYTGYQKLLSSFSDQLSSSKTAVTDQYDKQKASLDSRYEILTQKFIAYDAIISKLNNSFSVLESAIKAQYADNN